MTEISTDNPLVGDWTYRSFLNLSDPIPNTDTALLSVILFGQGDMRLAISPQSGFDGSYISFGEAYVMEIAGETFPGSNSPGRERPPAIKMEATGLAGTAVDGWIYAYQGYLVPQWPDGVNQLPAIVGSVIRVVPHNGEPAGVVASFIAVKRA
jgi:hypothetical protein